MDANDKKIEELKKLKEKTTDTKVMQSIEEKLKYVNKPIQK